MYEADNVGISFVLPVCACVCARVRMCVHVCVRAPVCVCQFLHNQYCMSTIHNMTQ